MIDDAYYNLKNEFEKNRDEILSSRNQPLLQRGRIEKLHRTQYLCACQQSKRVFVHLSRIDIEEYV